jgi:hypothetical protein
MEQRKPRTLTEKISRDARDRTTPVGRVVQELVGDIAGKQPQRIPFSQRLGKLSDEQLERVADAVTSERTRRWDAEADDDSGDDSYDDSDDEEDASSSAYIEPVPDEEIAARKAAYDEAELAKMSPAARAALELVEDAARLVPEQ